MCCSSRLCVEQPLAPGNGVVLMLMAARYSSASSSGNAAEHWALLLELFLSFRGSYWANCSSHREKMKESVSKLILFAAETKLERKTLQQLEFILAFYPNFTILYFSWLRLCMAKIVCKDSFLKWELSIWNIFGFVFMVKHVFILHFVWFVILSNIEELCCPLTLLLSCRYVF